LRGDAAHQYEDEGKPEERGKPDTEN
jgi:hypothetical protein